MLASSGTIVFTNFFCFRLFVCLFVCLLLLLLLFVVVVVVFFLFVFLRHNSSLVCIAGTTYVYVDTIFAFMGTLFFPLYPSLLLSWMFEHDCLDTCCIWCLICKGFVFFYLHLSSAAEHVSHGKALQKYPHY